MASATKAVEAFAECLVIDLFPERQQPGGPGRFREGYCGHQSDS